MDPGFTRTHIATNIVTGIGFLGAGAIVREGGHHLVITVGLGIGAGDIYFSLTATAITLLILLVVPKIDKVEKALMDCSLRGIDHHRTKTEHSIIGTSKTIGAPTNQEKFVQIMMKDKDVKDVGLLTFLSLIKKEGRQEAAFLFDITFSLASLRLQSL